MLVVGMVVGVVEDRGYVVVLVIIGNANAKASVRCWCCCEAERGGKKTKDKQLARFFFCVSFVRAGLRR